MQFLHPDRDSQLELSLDDVFLVPNYYEGTSRRDVDLLPLDFVGGSHPLISANMNAVTGKRMAETMARYGGLGVLPQDMHLDTVERIIQHIKQADTRFDTPLFVTCDATLRDVQGIIRKRAHDMVIVVDDEHRPVGIVTHADLRERDQYSQVVHWMSREMVLLPLEIDNQEAFLRMAQQRVKAAPVVDEHGRLKGILTRDDAVRLELLKPSLNEDGHLLVSAALGISSDVGQRAAQLLEMGVDVLVLDTAHGHQRRMIEAIRVVRKVLQEAGASTPLVAGNVCTEHGTRDLIEAGADIIKVNVGPGAMCTTRMQTGVGRPSFSSVRACALEAARHGRYVWADGGVRHPRDVARYLAAGAARVMVGTMLCGTFESPADMKEDADGRLFKENYGMASARAVLERNITLDPFEQAKKAFFKEGISTSRIYLRDEARSVGDIMVNMITGVQSAFTYIGAKDIATFQERAVVGVQTRGGFVEGTPHGRTRH
jgi:IMP dehydrogenase